LVLDPFAIEAKNAPVFAGMPRILPIFEPKAAAQCLRLRLFARWQAVEGVYYHMVAPQVVICIESKGFVDF
jgi:hypothetical protein